MSNVDDAIPKKSRCSLPLIIYKGWKTKDSSSSKNVVRDMIAGYRFNWSWNVTLVHCVQKTFSMTGDITVHILSSINKRVFFMLPSLNKLMFKKRPKEIAGNPRDFFAD